MSFPADQVIGKTFEDAKHWTLSQNREVSMEIVSLIHELKWQAPTLDQVKCNISFFWNKAKFYPVHLGY